MIHGRSTLPTNSPATDAPRAFRLTTHRPAPDTAVVEVAGDLDLATAPRLRELIAAEAAGPLTRLVIDVRGVRFLSATGLAAIEDGHLLATGRGIVSTVRVASAGAVLRLIRLLPVRFADALELV
ncbi:STAS domain-containing protein [Amycolatopsis sp. lyj-346]|uniref:STAS domain-containing protein n=1 Tax=Amycolatopsis sp. lyj-346 TaxID=2789289 RepID=UPI00397C8467